MRIFEAAFLGVVQGLTEFLPISSSAHLIVLPWLFGWRPEGLIFDVALHVGTAAAVVAYFWKDWMQLIGEMLRGLAEGAPLGNAHRRLGWFIVVGTLPAVAAGLLLDDFIEVTLRSPMVPAATLVIFGAVLYMADRRSRRTRSLEQFTWADSLWIGFSQAIALIPGVSRSGITITTALFLHVDRSSAARYSFLLSTPVILGAGSLECWRLFEALSDPAAAASGALVDPTGVRWTVLAAGVLFSAVTGFLCIRFFLRYLRSNSFLPFVLYRFALAAVLLVGQASGV